LVRDPIATGACVLLATAAALTGPSAPALGQDGIDQIVVTVRQREESVIDVPGTVSVLSAEAIAASGVERARDFIALTPGVTIVNAAEVADSQVNIRGINGARDAETNYALIIDGILMTNPAALNREYSNLKQIEVLKGPQGAIYGRNAAAGAFVITTEKPGETLSGNVKASAAQDDSYYLSGLVGGGLTDTIRWSLDGNYRDTDGYYSYVDTGSAFPAEYYPSPGCDDCVDYFEDWDVTGRMIWEPSDVLSVDAKLRYGEVDASSIVFNSVFHLPDLVGILEGGFGLPADFAAKAYENVNEHRFQFNPNVKHFNDQDSLEFSVKADYDLGWADLTAWGLYSDIDNSFGADGTSGAFQFFFSDPRCIDSVAALAGFPLAPPQLISGTPATSILGAYTPTSCDGTQYQERNQEDYSFEVRLASKADQRLRWLGGLYYLNIDREVGVNTGLDTGAGIVESLFTTDPANPTQQLVHDDFDTDVYAVFGQLAYDITEDIEASLAVRYDREEREVHNLVPASATTAFIDTCIDNLFGDPTPGADPINPGLCPSGTPIPDKDETWDQVEPKLAFTWDVLDNLTAYASAGMGFKSGGFNSQGSSATIDGFINGAVVVGTTPGATGCADVVANGGFSCVNVEDQFDEETSWSYEAGAKGSWGENRWRGEIAVFHTDVDDMQFFEFFVGPFGLLRVVSNIDEVSIDGIEATVNWLATDWLELYAGYAVTDSEIEKNVARPDTVGNESPYTPDWTGNFGGRMTYPLNDDIEFIYSMDFSLVGETWFHPVQEQERPTLFTLFGFGNGEYSVARRDDYTIVNARIGVQGDNWSVVLFGKNVFDDDYVEEVIPAPEFGGSFIHAGTKDRFGLEATYRF
jgi:iron complex outermembrane receptor protein